MKDDDQERIKAYSEKPPVKTYAGGKPNYCTPEVFTLDRGCWERGCVAYDERDGDGVTIKPERVDETAKGEHEPVGWLDSEGRFSYFKHLDSDEPLYLAPPKREWVGLTDEEIVDLACSVDSYKGLVQAVEAKLKEKNGG